MPKKSPPSPTANEWPEWMPARHTLKPELAKELDPFVKASVQFGWKPPLTVDRAEDWETIKINATHGPPNLRVVLMTRWVWKLLCEPMPGLELRVYRSNDALAYVYPSHPAINAELRKRGINTGAKQVVFAPMVLEAAGLSMCDSRTLFASGNRLDLRLSRLDSEMFPMVDEDQPARRYCLSASIVRALLDSYVEGLKAAFMNHLKLAGLLREAEQMRAEHFNRRTGMDRRVTPPRKRKTERRNGSERRRADGGGNGGKT